MARFIFIASALFLAFGPLLNYFGVREASRWDMYAQARRICTYDIYPAGTGPEQRLNITRDDFQAAPKLFVISGREQWRSVIVTLCRKREDLRAGRFHADLNCFNREWANVFSNQPVFCER